MTTSKPMTSEQLDELMTVAVRMQRDAEVDRNYPSANFAYAVQVAVLELRRTREISSALAAENAALKNYICDECYVENIKTGATKCAGHGMPETQATDVYQAEVRAQGIDAAIEHLNNKFEGTGHIGVPVMALEWLAAQLRQDANTAELVASSTIIRGEPLGGKCE